MICLPLHGSSPRVPQWRTFLHLHCFSTALHAELGREVPSASMCGLRQTPDLQLFPDLAEAATAFPQYTQPGIDPRHVVRLENVYLQACCCGLHICAAGRQSAFAHVRSRQPLMPQRDGADDHVLLWHTAKAGARHRLSRNGTGASGQHVQAAADHRMAGWGAWLRQRTPRGRQARERRGRTWRWRSWWSACAARRSRTRRGCAPRSPARPWTTWSSTCPAPCSCCARPGALPALEACAMRPTWLLRHSPPVTRRASTRLSPPGGPRCAARRPSACAEACPHRPGRGGLESLCY